jgi:hypothetical protein
MQGRSGSPKPKSLLAISPAPSLKVGELRCFPFNWIQFNNSHSYQHLSIVLNAWYGMFLRIRISRLRGARGSLDLMHLKFRTRYLVSLRHDVAFFSSGGTSPSALFPVLAMDAPAFPLSRLVEFQEASKTAPMIEICTSPSTCSF